MFSRSTNRLLWAGVLVLVVFFGFQARDTLENFHFGIGRLDVVDSEADGTLYLSWRGKIDAPMAARIAEAYETAGRARRRIVLTLSSPGGALDHGAEVVRLLQRMADTHEFETRVEARRHCASMCVPIYLQGEQRTAASSAQFMFHEVSFRDFYTEEAAQVPSSATSRATDKFFERYFVPAGVPEGWIRGVRAQMTGGHDVWKSAGELVEDNAGIVQKIL